MRLVASTGADLEKLLEDVIGNRPRFNPAGPATDGPHVVIVLDGADLKGATQLDDGIDGVTVLDLDEPAAAAARPLAAGAGGAGRRRQRALHTYAMDHAAEVGTPDRLTVAEAEAVARRLAPLRLAAMSQVGRTLRWPPRWAWPSCSASATRTSFSVGAGLAAAAQPGQAAGADRRRRRRRRRSSWTSRSPPRTAWARTAC